MKQDIFIPQDEQGNGYTSSQWFAYDGLNRLQNFVEAADYPPPDCPPGQTCLFWGQTYQYDRYGNRTINQNSSFGFPKPQFTVDPNTNRLGVPNGQSGAMTYDAAGNLTFDSYTGEGSRVYDAENRMTQAWANNQWQVYNYDGDGRRVKRNVNGTETWQVYGLGGELLAEYAANTTASNPQKEYGYRNGQLLVTAESSANIHWLVADHLGTPRMIFDNTGSLSGMNRHDYLPFGEELSAGANWRTPALGYTGDGTRQKFTSKERDNETGLDYFLARYYSSIQGRFTSPDEFKGGPSELWVLGSGDSEKQALVYADATNPQSLNKYQYTFNNPLRYVDPDGQLPQDGLEIRLRQDERALLEGKITEEEFLARARARGYGAIAGLAVLASYYLGKEAVVAILIFAARNPDKIEQVALDLTMASTGSPAPRSLGTLTLNGTTRLTVEEANTGARLAAQIGQNLRQSSHIGAEFVSAAGKTYDAMGVPAAYASKNWGNGSQFFESIVRHVNKSVDHVAIDLTGASKSQIKAIQKFASRLTEEPRKKIIYVQ